MCSRKRWWVWFRVFTYGISMTVNWVWYKHRAAETNCILAKSKKNRRRKMPMGLAFAFAPIVNKWVISQYNSLHTCSLSIMGTPREGAECTYARLCACALHILTPASISQTSFMSDSVSIPSEGERKFVFGTQCSVKYCTYRPEYPALTSLGMPIVTVCTQFRFSQNPTSAGPPGTKLLRKSGSVCILRGTERAGW